MKLQRNLGIAVIFTVLAIFTSCQSQTSGDKATISEEQQGASVEGTTYMVETHKSWIRFVGYGVGKNHPGKFKISSGTVAIAGNQVSGGSFEINIKSMELEQKEAMFQEKLRTHLLSADFFDTDQFGTAKFEITEVKPFEKSSTDTSIMDGANFRVSGNLTLKDVTKNVSFPAKIDLANNTLMVIANFVIDRTQWQMTYGNDKALKDKFISENVAIELNVEANKQ